jgi:hypothetical protein
MARPNIDSFRHHGSEQEIDSRNAKMYASAIGVPLAEDPDAGREESS